MGADLAAAPDPNRSMRALLGLSRLERQGGNLQGALAVLAAAGDGVFAAVASMQVTLAAQLGNRRLRAEGLLHLLGGVSAQARALLASVAAGELTAVGERDAALGAAEVATHADPSLARPVVAYADAVLGRGDRVAAVAYERAMALSLPSSAHCQALVGVLDALGETHASERWTARWLGLRPSHTAAALQPITVATRERDAARLGDVLAWAVSQAHPLKAWEARARRRLGLFGGAGPGARGTDGVAPAGCVRARAARVAACGVGRRRKGARRRAGDRDTRARARGKRARCRAGSALVAAVRAALRTQRYGSRVYSAGAGARSRSGRWRSSWPARRGSGCRRGRRVNFIGSSSSRSRANARTRRCPPRRAPCANTAPRSGISPAIASRRSRSGCAQRSSLPMTAGSSWRTNLGEVLGPARALDEIGRIAETLERPAQAAALLTGAGLVAFESGLRRQALQLALLALDSEPASPTALALVESAAGPADTQSLEHAYAAALGATVGRYGERALHYRAARFLEQRREQRAALGHAIEAFRAVPSEGGAFVMMSRLIDTTDDAARAALVVEEVARRAPAGRERAEWLRRAALIIGRSEDGAQQRVELLLRALVDYPDPEIVALLGRAFTDLSRHKADGRQLGLVRFERAVLQILPRLDPMDGTRAASAMALVSLACFGDAPLALKALTVAVQLDPEADDFAELLPDAARLAEQRDAARIWLGVVHEAMGAQQRASQSLLDLATEVALAGGVHGEAARFLTLKSERQSDDEKVRARAKQAVSQSRDTDLPDYVVRAFPAEARRSELLGRAELCASKGDRGGELMALREALNGPLELPRDVLVRLVKLAGSAHEFELAEHALRVVASADIEPEALLQLGRSLAALMLEQRAPQRALKLLEDVMRLGGEDVAVLTQALAAARASADDQARRRLLARLIELTSDPIKKRLWFSEAWEVARKVGDSQDQTNILRRWLASDPEDTTPLLRLEAEAEAREAWSELCELLAQHLALPLSTDERRRLGLKLSYLLESKLGRLEQAQRELTVLCDQLRGDREVVERLAQVTQQLGDRSGAANLWLSASALQATRAQASEFAARAGRMFLDAGDFMAARRVLAAPQSVPRTLELFGLAVRLEREGGNEPRLARALEELGGAPEQSAILRAGALLEAAGLWHRLNELARALGCAAQAAESVPHDPTAQLTLSELEYRQRGAGTRAEAERTIARLRGIGSHWSPEQRNLVGFLLAEALEVVEGPDAALRELYEHDRFGPVPLVSAAIAERLANGSEPRKALAHFDLALKGELHELFRPSNLALSAARAALRAQLPERARQYLELAATDPELAAPVARLREQLESARPRDSVPPAASEPAPTPVAALHESSPPDAPERRSWGRTTRIGLGEARRQEPAPEPARTAGRSSAPPSLFAVPGASIPAGSDAQWSQLSAQFRPQKGREEELFHSFTRRSPEAGLELLSEVEREPVRAHDRVVLARMLVWLLPGDAEALRRLKQAAEADRDAVFSAALAHIVDGVLGGRTGEFAAPGLGRQVEQPQNLRALLFGELVNPSTEALAILWQSARARALTALCARRSRRDPARRRRQFGVRRLFPADALVRRQAHPAARAPRRERPAVGARVVRYRAGGARRRRRPRPTRGAVLRARRGARRNLAAECAPLHRQRCARRRAISRYRRRVRAEESSAATFVGGARLAELLWKNVPPRAQRRLTELCAQGSLSRSEALKSAQRAAARAGLYATGNLATALLKLTSPAKAAQLVEPGGLALLCKSDPAAADLLRLATSPQYAEARFRTDRARRGAGFSWRVR